MKNQESERLFLEPGARGAPSNSRSHFAVALHSYKPTIAIRRRSSPGVSDTQNVAQVPSVFRWVQPAVLPTPPVIRRNHGKRCSRSWVSRETEPLRRESCCSFVTSCDSANWSRERFLARLVRQRNCGTASRAAKVSRR